MPGIAPNPMDIAMIAGGLLQTGMGLIGQGKANRIAKYNKRPEYEVASQIRDNAAIAESMAQEGLSDSAKQLYTTNADRGITNSIDAILRAGGNPNQIADLYDNYGQGLSRLALAEDEAKFRNINLFMKANTMLADEYEKAWQINKFAPYADKAQEAAKLSGQANNNINGGLNTMLSAGASFMQGRTNPTAGVPTGGGATARSTQFASNSVPTVSQRAAQVMSGLGVLPPTPLRTPPIGEGSFSRTGFANRMWNDINSGG